MPSSPLLSIPYLDAGDPPSIHGVTSAMASRLDVVVPKAILVTGSITSSSATPVDIPGAAYTVDVADGSFVDLLTFSVLGPSASGDAKVNLVIGGTNYGQIAQGNAGSGSADRWSLPGSTTGHAVAGAWLTKLISPGSTVIKAQASSTSGSAGFNVTLLLRIWNGNAFLT